MILPQIDQGPLHDMFDADVSIADASNQSLRNTILPIYQCPSDPKPDKWEIEEEGSPGTVLAELPTGNYISAFGTEELDGCENTPGTAPVTGAGQCRGDGAFFHNSRVRIRDVNDGLSNTLFTGERRTDPNLGWYSTWVGMVPEGEEAFQRVLGSVDHVPNDPHSHFDDFSSHHEGGTHFLLGDGQVRFVTESIDHGLYQALGTIHNGETVGEF